VSREPWSERAAAHPCRSPIVSATVVPSETQMAVVTALLPERRSRHPTRVFRLKGVVVSQFHVNQIETHIRDRYGDGHWIVNLDDVANLSRLLALHAVNLVLGGAENDGQRIVEITDGEQDRGIDAVGVDSATKLVVFVQSKWRQDGTHSMSLADVLKFLQGVRSLLGMQSKNEPAHADEATRKAIHDLLRMPGAKIRLVTATTAIEPLADEVQAPINELLGQLNDLEGTEPLATHVHFGQGDFFNALTEEARPKVDLEFVMQDWGRANEPLKIFYGRVGAAEIARWYQDHGAGLFAENIRVVVPRSDINDGILSTICEEPERFGYYNNGITVLAYAVEISPAGMLNRDVGYFRLSNASIVNGAQTVSTLGKVLGTKFEGNLGRAFVLVRCIEVHAEDTDLGRRITRFANTQNEVSSQDFAFLDSQQHRLVRELRVLGYEYILRSAESPTSQDPSKVIDVRQAAVALACCSTSLANPVIAKREVSRLFSDSSVYPSLFNPHTDALRLVRAVQITRAVDDVLDKVEQETAGVEAGVAVHGRRVIAYLVMRHLGDAFMEDPQSDIEAVLNGIENPVRDYLTKLVAVFPESAYPGNVFKNQARCSLLLKEAELGS